jgi:hypothetical protein
MVDTVRVVNIFVHGPADSGIERKKVFVAKKSQVVLKCAEGFLTKKPGWPEKLRPRKNCWR